ncbi:MAG: hypothetical protein IKO36_05610 [Bacteroidaceae bacterium]|nr:hypothetical protein [Bacteroidaceae bacterium]
MTKKQTIIAAIAELENALEKFYNTKGIVTGRIPRITKYDRNSYTIYQYATKRSGELTRVNTLYDLERMYAQLQIGVRKVLENWGHSKFANSEWYQTLKAEADNAEAVCINACTEANKKYFNIITAALQKKLGSRCAISCMSSNNFEIGIFEKTISRPEESITRNSLKFGHSFSVYNRCDNFEIERRGLEINYGCMGSFNPVLDEDRVLFLNYLSNFASDYELQALVYKAMNDYKTEQENACKIAKESKDRFEKEFNKILEATDEFDSLMNKLQYTTESK